MKKILTALTIAILALGGSLRADEASFPDISVTDLKKAIEDKKATVLDVNGSDSYASAHVPGAHDFSAIKADLATKLPKEKDALIVAYCGGPKCSAYKAAAKAAKELGYTNVKHLSAGISGWTKAGEKTEAAKKEEKKDKDAKSTSDASAAGKHSYVATFTGVTCSNCKSHVTDAIAKLPGGSDVKFAAGEEKGTQLVTFNATCDKVCASKIAEVLGEDSKTYVVTSLKLADK